MREPVRPICRSASPRSVVSATGTTGRISAHANGVDEFSKCTRSDWRRIATLGTCSEPRPHPKPGLQDQQDQQQVANRLAHQRGLSPNPLTDRPIGRGQSTGEGSRASEEESGESTGFDDDDESEDDEEEESEEDRAFIYDDELEEDLTFYRGVDLERGLEPLPLTAKRRDPTPPAAPHKSGWQKKAQRLLTELPRHVTQLVVVGFNSGKYDLNMLKEILIPYLVYRSGIDLTIKRNQAYLALRTSRLKFVDISNFLEALDKMSQFWRRTASTC